MNKIIFYIIILVLAIGTTLGLVYFININSMNQNMNEISDIKVEDKAQQSNDTENVNPLNNIFDSGQIIVDENTPKNYNNPELLEIEKEINSLDLSSENDIE
jgi:hypothetical protein